MVSVYLLHSDPLLYEDPEEFRPEGARVMIGAASP
jgi:cytochrome P450